ncbi:antitoxin VbhA family protein [Sphingomonas sp. PAMC 26605]|uniref:antitoxin VbhA family protein n=1 Tax=Sphingomonas sp. PAMC 26605 TaxID=1112214 RepID=UPI00026CD20A|nr:antitoxin VbhA family protein [Sphingomonas sp. PAMC 26605]
MNVQTPIKSSVPAISDEERASRLRAVNFARGSVRYEGGIQTEEVEVIAARYVDGGLTLDEYIAAVKASDTVRLA